VTFDVSGVGNGSFKLQIWWFYDWKETHGKESVFIFLAIA